MTTEQHADPPLIDPRDAIAELGRISFDDTSMEAVLQRVAELAKHVIPGVAEASVTLIANDKPSTAAYTGRLALDLDETQYSRGYGPCLEAAVGEEIREITDARTETRWPDYTRVAVERGSLSSLSAPCRCVKASMPGSTCMPPLSEDGVSYGSWSRSSTPEGARECGTGASRDGPNSERRRCAPVPGWVP